MPEEVLTVSSKKTWTEAGGEASTDPSAGTVRRSVAWPQAYPGRARATIAPSAENPARTATAGANPSRNAPGEA